MPSDIPNLMYLSLIFASYDFRDQSTTVRRNVGCLILLWLLGQYVSEFLMSMGTPIWSASSWNELHTFFLSSEILSHFSFNVGFIDRNSSDVEVKVLREGGGKYPVRMFRWWSFQSVNECVAKFRGRSSLNQYEVMKSIKLGV